MSPSHKTSLQFPVESATIRSRFVSCLDSTFSGLNCWVTFTFTVIRFDAGIVGRLHNGMYCGRGEVSSTQLTSELVILLLLWSMTTSMSVQSLWRFMVQLEIATGL